MNIEQAAEACMRLGYRRGVYNVKTDEMEWVKEDGSGAYAIIHDERGQNCKIELVSGKGQHSNMAKETPATPPAPAPASPAAPAQSPQERAAIDKEIAQVNKDTGAREKGGKTDGDYAGEGGNEGGYEDDPYNH